MRKQGILSSLVLIGVLLLAICWSRLGTGTETNPARTNRVRVEGQGSLVVQPTVWNLDARGPSSAKYLDYETFHAVGRLGGKNPRLLNNMTEEQYRLWGEGKFKVPDEPPYAGLLADFNNDGRLDRALPVRYAGQSGYRAIAATRGADSRWHFYGSSSWDSLDPATIENTLHCALLGGGLNRMEGRLDP